jgi:hypothetical protein
MMSVVSRDDRAALAPLRRQYQSLGGAARQVERERPQHVRGRRHTGCEGQHLTSFRYRLVEVPLRLLAPGEPRERMCLQVWSVQALSQRQGFSGPSFDGSNVEQEKQGSSQRQHQLAAANSLFRIEVAKRRIQFTCFHRPLAEGIEGAGATRVQFNAQTVDLGVRCLELERVQSHAEEPDGLFVRQRIGCLIASACRVFDRLSMDPAAADCVK